MDAIKFIEERNRMCESFGTGCIGCPAYDESHCVVSSASTLDAKEQVAIVEKWSAAHPRKTRQGVFLERYPDARCSKNDVLAICPSVLSSSHRHSDGRCANTKKRCEDCRREYWMQEVE